MVGKLIKILYDSVGKRRRRFYLREQQCEWEWRGKNKFEKYLEGRFKRTLRFYVCGNEGEKGVKDKFLVFEWMIVCNFLILQ